jgi:hypothetical protein
MNYWSSCTIDLSYWALTTGVEVDFILNDMEVAIEASTEHGFRWAAKPFLGLIQKKSLFDEILLAQLYS